MIIKTLLVLITLNISSFLSKAQDSTIYKQNDAAMFSNTYVFYANGTFKHFYTTDDGQVWYGTGNFFDNRRHRTLYFKEADTTLNSYEGWQIHYETNFQRVLNKTSYGFKSFEKNSNTGKPGVRLSKREP